VTAGAIVRSKPSIIISRASASNTIPASAVIAVWKYVPMAPSPSRNPYWENSFGSRTNLSQALGVYLNTKQNALPNERWLFGCE